MRAGSISQSGHSPIRHSGCTCSSVLRSRPSRGQTSTSVHEWGQHRRSGHLAEGRYSEIHDRLLGPTGFASDGPPARRCSEARKRRGVRRSRPRDGQGRPVAVAVGIVIKPRGIRSATQTAHTEGRAGRIPLHLLRYLALAARRSHARTSS